MIPAVGKSGAGMSSIRSSIEVSGLRSSARQPSTTSFRLCGGMLVAMPTAMPETAVDQQVRQFRRQQQRLVLRAVVVRPEVDRFLLDVGEQFVRDLGEPDLRVSHRRGTVAVDRAEVALAIDEHVAQREVLRHPDDGVVDRLVAVRVVLADDVADDARRLLVRPVPVIRQFMHREQHATVHRLQAVAHVGQRATDDDAHRVVEIGPPHLLFERDRQGFLGKLIHRGAVRRAAASGARRM